MITKEKPDLGGAGQKTCGDGNISKQLKYKDFSNISQEINLQAVEMAEKGLSVLPVDPKTKRPLEAWKHLQTNPLTPGQLTKMEFSGVALISGKVSGHLEAIDFDLNAIWFEAWQQIVESEAPGLTNKLLIQETQSGGLHCVYRCPELEIPGNQKLAHDRIKVDGPGVHEYLGSNLEAQEEKDCFYVYPCLIETRGEGGYFLAAPTPGYQVINGHSFLALPEITLRERQILYNAAKALNKWVKPVREPRDYSTEPDGERPGDIYNEKNEIPRDLLERAGWRSERANGNFEHWTRPGKERGGSASIIDGKLFYVFSSNAAPFEPEKAYSPFSVFALLEHNGNFSAAAQDLKNQGYTKHKLIDGPIKGPEKPAEKQAWIFARELFPRTPYPWEILPETIANCFKALARSTASDANPIPGLALAFIAAALGRTIWIRPKIGWNEPVILWIIDVRESGEGKTAPMWLLADVLKNIQKQAHDRYKRALEEWQASPKKERGKSPELPRGYYCTDLTLEGVRSDLEQHPTGGLIALLNEASSLITGQNQYKARGGTDREAWLNLHDGQPARIVRAEKTILITGARVQIAGGIQPEIFKRVFGGYEGQYLADGTIYRALFTYNPPEHHPLTAIGWTEADREPWEKTLQAAFEWADRQEEPLFIWLERGAQELFFEWRNNLDQIKNKLPREIRGFLPKAYGYALRLAGALECLDRFSQGQKPRALLDALGMEKGIKAAMYYLGQSVDAVRLILGDELIIDQVQTKILEALQTGPMTATEINNDVFQRNTPAGKIQEALQALVETGQIKEEIQSAHDGKGRPTKIYSRQ